MGTRFEITNISQGPKGFPEIGKSRETVIARGDTKVLTVAPSIADLIRRMAKPKEGQRRADLEISDLGPVDALDHDGDDRKGGTRQPTTPAPAPAPAPAGTGGLDFDSLQDDQLRSYLASLDVKFHPNTGREKLLAKAKEAEKAAEAAQTPSPAAPAAPPAEPAEAV